MSTGARTEASGPSAAGVADGGGRAAGPPDAAGRLLGRLSVLPALLVMAWLLAGLPLLLGGRVHARAECSCCRYRSPRCSWCSACAGLPAGGQAAWPALAPEQARTPWWAVAGVVVVAVAFGVDQLIYHSQFIIVTRDPASYIQFANWIAHHGSLPIPQDRAAFGGTHHVLTLRQLRLLPGRHAPWCRSSWPGCRWCWRRRSGPAA